MKAFPIAVLKRIVWLLNVRKKEAEANAFAERWLIKDRDFQKIAAQAPFFEQKIIALSQQYRIPAGIIIGRLQHQGLVPRKAYNSLKRRVDLL